MKDSLVALTNARMDDWDQNLEIIAHAYWTTENVTTKFTPSYMLYGREYNEVSPELLHQDNRMTENEHIYNLRKMLLQTQEMTGARMEAD
jgi:hypothetical protein